MRNDIRIGALRACLAIVCFAATSWGAQPELEHRWVYLSTNMLVDKNVQKAVELIARSGKAGYTGVALTDSKFMRWNNLPARYRQNVAKVRQAIRAAGMQCVACVFPIGYSEGLLAHDPNLAASLPVRAAPFVVRSGKCVPVDDSARLLNGDFEEHSGNSPAGWRWADEPGKITFIDTSSPASGKVCLRMQDIDRYSRQHGHGRIMQTLKVHPFRYYHVSAMVRTEGFTTAGQVRIAVLAKGGTSLNYYEPTVAPTQGWKQIDVTFNSLEFDEVNLYLGVWGGKGGKLWWDDVRLEPGGLVNVVRRAGAPLRAATTDGAELVEGRDFMPIRDPKLGTVPWPGGFSAWHDQPAVAIPPASRLKEGRIVLLSYYHTALIHHGQVACDMTEPKVYEILAWQARKVRDEVRPDVYFMQHDEIRVQGWEPVFEARKITPGQALADNVRRCAAILRMTDPGKPIYVWSDMFDPQHNARPTGRYYLVKGDGPWSGSWKGLDKDVGIVNWHGHKEGRVESLRFFAGRGHKQVLAGYYDGPPRRIRDWLADAEGVSGAIGVMYTTWRSDYTNLEKFAAQLLAR